MNDIYFELPLYKRLEFHENENDIIQTFLSFFAFKGKIDGYNPSLNENTSYKVETKRFGDSSSIRSFLGKNEHILNCVRTGFKITYYFLLEDHMDEETEETTYIFQKIGQYPTIADIELGKHKKYTKILTKNYLKEFNKAIGLSANGVGIGSFVYLRRIFEKLIEDYHQKAKMTKNWNEKEYINSRISEKIGYLKDFLPEAIVKYKSVYSIISKGIHELEEQECLKYFPIVKDAIVAILEQDYLNRENENKQKELENNIENIVKKLK